MTLLRPLALLAAGLLCGCSHVMKAQMADAVTTGVGLGAGAVESNAAVAGLVANPAGLAAWAGAKLYLSRSAAKMPPAQCRVASGALFGAGAGAGASNLLVITGAASGGAGLIVPLGLASWAAYEALKGYKHDCRAPTKEEEREEKFREAYLLAYRRLQGIPDHDESSAFL